jgi:valyl-tRNA synthetase
MTADLPTQYTAQETEAKWQRHWESQQTYRADSNASGDPFCVVIPPPNVTGSLHMGHNTVRLRKKCKIFQRENEMFSF